MADSADLCNHPFSNMARIDTRIGPSDDCPDSASRSQILFAALAKTTNQTQSHDKPTDVPWAFLLISGARSPALPVPIMGLITSTASTMPSVFKDFTSPPCRRPAAGREGPPDRRLAAGSPIAGHGVRGTPQVHAQLYVHEH